MRIQTIVFAALLSLFPASALAQDAAAEPCLTTTKIEGRLNDLLAQWTDFGVAETEALCLRLQTAGAGINITYDTGELEGLSFGWVMLRLYDVETGVHGLGNRASITTSVRLGEVEQDLALRDALESGLRGLAAEPDLAIESMQEQVAAMRLVHGQ